MLLSLLRFAWFCEMCLALLCDADLPRVVVYCFAVPYITLRCLAFRHRAASLCIVLYCLALDNPRPHRFLYQLRTRNAVVLTNTTKTYFSELTTPNVFLKPVSVKTM